jgi:hypothetical protein
MRWKINKPFESLDKVTADTRITREELNRRFENLAISNEVTRALARQVAELITTQS